MIARALVIMIMMMSVMVMVCNADISATSDDMSLNLSLSIPKATSDGTTIDQSVGYILMFLALALTYIIH